MIRTVVHPRPGVAATKPAADASSDSTPPDTYKDKLLKYVPAETVAIFLPAYALAKSEGTAAILATTLVALLGSLGYLKVRAPATSPPRWFFYVLSAIAFLGWAIGTSSLGSDLFGWPDQIKALVVLGTVFLVPLADEAISHR